MRRFVVPIAFSALIVAIAPFVAGIRDSLKEALDGSFRLVMGAAFVGLVVVTLGWVAAAIREDRARRFALLVVGLGLMAGQLLGWNREDADVNAVERIHFVFYGAVTFLFFRAYRLRRDGSVLVLTWLSAGLVALADESVQWASEVRTGELLDIGINVYAALCTLFVCVAWAGTSQTEWRLSRSSVPAIACQVAVVIVATAAFVDFAHLGYGNSDPAIGSFRSYFTVEQLETLSRARETQWVTNPPGKLAPLNREDYFRSEAGWHVRHRQEALSDRDFYVAGKENDILEKYYAPFLRLPDAQGNPFAFNPDERRRVEGGRPLTDPYPYDSPVFRDPLRIWITPSRLELWIFSLVACASVLAVAVFHRRLSRRARSLSE